MMFQNEITKEEVDNLDLIQFEGHITVVEDMDVFRREIGVIRRLKLIGFDTETKPSFRKGKVNPTSLIQMAMDHQGFQDRVPAGAPGFTLQR